MSEWIKWPETAPLFENDTGDEKLSKRVLVLDDGYITVGYLRVYMMFDGDDVERQWIESGRDGYHLDDVTHWMALPDKPF